MLFSKQTIQFNSNFKLLADWALFNTDGRISNWFSINSQHVLLFNDCNKPFGFK